MLRTNYKDSWSESNTTCEHIILFKRCSLEVTTCFGLLLGHNQVVCLIQGNYTIRDIMSLLFNEISSSSIKPFL